MQTILTLLQSNRVKALIFAVVLAYAEKNYPQYAPSAETLEWIYGAIIAFIAGDTFRPVDPAKRIHKIDANIRDLLTDALRRLDQQKPESKGI